MRRAKKKQRPQNTKIVFFFGLGIFFILFLSFLVKIFKTIQKSSFDSEHRFTTLIKMPEKTELISLSPKNGSSTQVIISGPITPEMAGKFLGIPINGFVETSNPFSATDSKESIFAYLLFHVRQEKTNLTFIDLVRLFLSAKSISKTSTQTIYFSFKESMEEVDKRIGSSMIDPTIYSENLSIQIVNSSDTQGLGFRLSRYISHLGGNVVLVATGEKIENTSLVEYVGKKSYTVQSLSKALNIKSIPISKKELGDVIIILGKDSSSRDF